MEKEQNESLTKDIVRKMTKAQEAFEGVTDQGDHDFLTTFSFISMLCFDVYMRKHMIEKMIDDCLMGESFKRSTGEVKKPETKKEVKPASKPTAKADVKTASKSTGKPVSKPASKPASKPDKKITKPE